MDTRDNGLCAQKPHFLTFFKRFKMTFRVDASGQCTLLQDNGEPIVPYLVRENRNTKGMVRRDFYFMLDGQYYYGFAVNDSIVNCREMRHRADS